jgi:hypothetical protein
MVDQILASAIEALIGGSADTFVVCAGAGLPVVQKTAAQAKTLLALTKSDVGLGSVDNTADTAKPVSTAQATADGLRVLKAGDTMNGALSLGANALTCGAITHSGDVTSANGRLSLRPTVASATGGPVYLFDTIDDANNGNHLIASFRGLGSAKMNIATGQVTLNVAFVGTTGTYTRNNSAACITLNNNAGLALQANGGITSTALICAGTYTVATLPSASANAYKFATVSDSSVTTLGSTVSGSGSSKVMVYSNGTNWTVCAA